MKRRLTILALTTLAVVALISVVLMAPTSTSAAGAEQIRGIGYPASEVECPPLPEEEWPEGTLFAVPPLKMSGSLTGCFYSFALTTDDSSSGTYRETGIDIYIGEGGRFETTYLFTAKFDEDGNEIWGRCQHPITEGTGEGYYSGVTGRLDLKDDIEAGNFPYKGHLRW